MKILKQTILALVAMSMVGAFASTAHAQNNNEQRRTAVQAYNQASEFAKKNEYDQAISKFQEALSAAGELGDSGSDIVNLVNEKLPAIYYDKALNEYRNFQNNQTVDQLDNTIQAFEEAADAGEEYGQSSIKDKSTSNVTKLTYTKSRLQYKQKNYAAALETIEKVIEENPNYATAYYQKALILKKQEGNFDTALAAFDKAIEVAEKSGNSEIAEKARENASGELVYRGANATQNKNYTTAIEDLNRALEYNPESSDAHFRLAEAYNERGDFDQGLQHAQKALELENGGRTDKAKIYFQIASSYKGKGNFSQACNNFANAAYGQFKQSAEHQMEFELKCEQN